MMSLSGSARWRSRAPGAGCSFVEPCFHTGVSSTPHNVVFWVILQCVSLHDHHAGEREAQQRAQCAAGSTRRPVGTCICLAVVCPLASLIALTPIPVHTMGKRFLSRHCLSEQASCLASVPFAAAGAADEEWCLDHSQTAGAGHLERGRTGMAPID